MFGHKAWYMDFEVNKQHPLQPELNTNFTGFTALAEKYKVDLYLAGHVHLYQRFYSLLGPAKHEANARCAPGRCGRADFSAVGEHTLPLPPQLPSRPRLTLPFLFLPCPRPQAIDKDCVEEDGKVYRNCKYMTTIIAGSPGDHELTTAGMCAGDQGARSESGEGEREGFFCFIVSDVVSCAVNSRDTRDVLPPS